MESQQLMNSLLPALKLAADDLMQRLKEGDYRHKVFRKITATKRKQFHSVRENYEVSKTTAPFVYWLWKVDDDSQANITNTIVRANLVSVLDSLRLIQIDKTGDALSFLRALDAAYEEGLFGEGGTDPALALRIRTAHFVEHLARQKGRLRTAEFIASVFCKKTNSVDFPSILANGPFRALGGKDDKGAAEVSSKRTHELETVMIENKKYGVEILKRRFPLIKLLGDLEKWALDEYEKVRDVDSQEDVFHDAEQGARESSEPDTQVVRRAPMPQSSLYAGRSSLTELNAPPSNQQQAEAEAAINMPPPPTPARNQGSKRPSPARPVATESGGNDDGDDDFETDSRAPLQRSGGASHPGLPPTSTSSSNPAHSQIEMDAVRGRGLATSSQARLQQRTELGRRTPWSAHDVEQLIRLVAKHRAAWSAIAKDETARWDRDKEKRGQQGLRDKARNLKVDFLLADMPLPPCFDLVALSSKEVRRVEDAGRNPHRREDELDENRQPTNKYSFLRR
ncbi:hypothetical protein ACCO45_010494 [Purpureocillium lilacinum]|uniref:Uncharacterized protein n=1 Tax=Purpureocillium lilacinum TaxID=33203 RepID=A0ACC4DF22_PURLI